MRSGNNSNVLDTCMLSELWSTTIYSQQSVCCVVFKKQDSDETRESFLFSLGEMEEQKF